MGTQTIIKSKIKDFNKLEDYEITEFKNIVVDEKFSGLSNNLIKKQRVSLKDIKNIEKLHLTKVEIYKSVAQKLKSMSNIGMMIKDDKIFFDKVNFEIEELEFRAQKYWGFKIDRNYHTWWLNVPGCSCPYFDNMDRTGTDQRIINQRCVIHGNRLESK